MWLTAVGVKKFPLGGSVTLAVTSVHGLVWKVERSKRYVEGMDRILSPRPPTGARRIQKQHSGPEGEHSESSESVSPNMRWTNSADRESVISLFKKNVNDGKKNFFSIKNNDDLLFLNKWP